MEKHRHVFEEFATFERLHDGYRLARRNKRFRPVVLDYSAHLEENIIQDVQRLRDGTYTTGEPRDFFELYPKVRLIHSLPFNDRVINCAAYLTLWPIYFRSMYEHNYGSVPGRGAEAAVRTVQRWLREVRNEDWYICKLDIAKFFFRIPYEVQLRELGRPLDDPQMMWFLETAIKCDGRAFGLPVDCKDVRTAERIQGIGMQVGSLVSQMTANVVLTPVDHFIKRKLRVPRYARYMDDMLPIVPGKKKAWEVVHEVDKLLHNEFGLQLNQKTAVIPARVPVEFVGRKITAEKVELRRSTSLSMKRHLAQVVDGYAEGALSLDYCKNVITSYLGMMSHCNNDALRDKVLGDFVLHRKEKEDGR